MENGQPTVSVCLGQPSYGDVTVGAARAFWRASSGSTTIAGEQVGIKLQANLSCSSLLALNFNTLWCWALNNHVDYFAMLHGDVEAEDFWLDKLITELEDNDLDVLSVVIPLKDVNGLTSTALDGADKWNPHCRLSMKEVYNLPELFTADDVGYPLLLNTGCWVCRFGEWAKDVHFTVNDQIVYSEKKQSWVPQIEPEDWNFSRQLNRLGLKLGATRGIRVRHRGASDYTNEQPWGDQEFDIEFVPESVIENDMSDGWRFPFDVDGWLLPEEGKALAELARGKDVLEIGTYCGKSTICMAQTAKGVIAIDPHDGRDTARPKNTLSECRANLERYDVAGRVFLIQDRPGIGENVDLVFIDGAHDCDSVLADIKYGLHHLKPDGLIAFHDYREHEGQFDGRWDPGVTQAVNEFLRDGAELVMQRASVAVVRPPQLQTTEI